MGNSKKRRAKEFKVDAAKLISEQGYRTSEAVRNIGIDPSVLRR